MKTSKILGILFLLISVCSQTEIMAVKAYPFPIETEQPDGEKITIQLHGDEHFHYITSGDNYVILKNEEGYYTFAEMSNAGEIIPGKYKVTNNSLKINKTGVIKSDDTGFIQYAKSRTSEQLAKNDLLKSSSASTISGKMKGLVILVSFSDVDFSISNTNTAFTNLLNQQGYSENGATGSARDYYIDNSDGIFTPEFDVYGPVKLSQKMEYYGANDKNGDDVNPQQMIVDACKLANQTYPGLNFADYDNDKDGWVDNVFVFYAGYNEAEGGGVNTVWPHQYNVYSNNVTLDGVRLVYYACTSELRGKSGTTMCGIGTFTHEFSHTMGLPDFYDADGSTNGEGTGIGYWSVMDVGNYLNNGRTPPNMIAMEKYMLGWMTPTVLSPTEEAQTIHINPISSNESYIINSPTENEYFIIENRKKNDKWDQYIRGEGLLIYHVDMSSTLNLTTTKETTSAKKLWEAKTPNIIGNHQCFDLLRAVPNTSDYTEMPFPTGNINAITDYTNPNLMSWLGQQSGVAITDITRNGNDGVVTFTFKKTNELLYPDVFTLETKEITQSSAKFNANLSNIGVSPILEKGFCWNTTGEPTVDQNKVVVSGTSTGEYSYSISSLNKYTTYYVRAYVKTSDSNIYYGASLSFTTLPDATNIPYSENFFYGRPAYWSVLDGNNDGKSWYFVNNSSLNMGFGVAAIDGNNNQANDWLITPQLYIPNEYSNVELKFRTVYFNKEILDIRVSDSYMEENLFETVTSYTLDDGTSYKDYSVSLNKYVGKNIFIAFINLSENGSQMWITNISVNKASSNANHLIDSPVVSSYKNVIRVNNINTDTKIEMYDINGNKYVDKTVGTDFEYETKNKGIYILKLYSDNQIFTHKIVIK